jgi:hypothetical protein
LPKRGVNCWKSADAIPSALKLMTKSPPHLHGNNIHRN